MQSNLLSFLLKLFLLTLLLGFVFYSVQEKIPTEYFFSGYAGLLVFFFGVTFLLHLGYEKNFKKGSKEFVRFYMLTSGLKLFGFLTILLVFGFIDREHVTTFAVNFLILYFIYTAFELIISFKKFGGKVKLPG